MNVNVAGRAQIAPRRRLVILAPGNARPGQPDAGIVLAARRDADMRATAANRHAYTGPLEVEPNARENLHATLKSKPHLYLSTPKQ